MGQIPEQIPSSHLYSIFFLCCLEKILNRKASARASLCLKRLQYTPPAKSFLFRPFENLIRMLSALLPLWRLWLLLLMYTVLTPVSVTVIMWTCYPDLAWRSEPRPFCVFYPPHLCCLGGHARLPCSLCPLAVQLANVSPLWMWPHCQCLGELLSTPFARPLISSSHLLPFCGLWF